MTTKSKTQYKKITVNLIKENDTRLRQAAKKSGLRFSSYLNHFLMENLPRCKN